MRKLNVICIVMAAVLSLSMAVPAVASEGLEDVLRHVDNVNDHIYREIEKAQKLADMALEQGDEEWFNQILFDLQYKASMLTATAIDWAARKGFEAVCTHVYAVVGGVEVMVDPIHILW